MNSKKNNILSLIFPDTCIVCKKPVWKSLYACKHCQEKISYLSPVFKCRTCLSYIPHSNSKICGFCLREKPEYSRLISCALYKGGVKSTMHAYKFSNRPDFHIGFSKLACEVLERDGVFFNAVICMPIHKNKLAERGYNQSVLIAKKIAEYFQVPFYEDLLIKVKETKTQSELKYAERKKNIKGAFGVNTPERINDCTVLLVDDIFTTGFTMREAARTCAPYTDDIIAFTIARGTLE